jgi:hypothetical protein
MGEQACKMVNLDYKLLRLLVFSIICSWNASRHMQW